MTMDMATLLSETASSVAEAASAVAASECGPVSSGQLPALSSFIPATSARPPAIEIPSDDDESGEEFDEDNPQWAKWSCQQIRAKIRNFLGTKEMTQTAFLKLCDINSNSFYRFMNLKGPYGGSDNQTYELAAIFFYRREKQQQEEKAKLKAVKPAERKRKAAEVKENKAKKAKTGDDLLQKIQDVELPDADEDGAVPVYDDCDEIRKKINYFLGEKTVTKAAFLRALGDVNSNSLRTFMNMKRGAGSGAANVVYRTAYVFFEKKRVLEGGKKTKKRLDNEAKQGPNGFPLRHDNGMRWVIVGKGM
ncbi:Major Facilitator Superfamily (MFS) [Phytophthora cinnamomi]|uniref:Major Facilitator Superfamily (MFS) n=1 Tax=Phytophthora cinnamomi TaxID=4785 RepID=UPI003559AD3C|nr:Major Facilitator Superfamily (MFS) [Phytophthora cinnamomi]